MPHAILLEAKRFERELRSYLLGEFKALRLAVPVGDLAAILHAAKETEIFRVLDFEALRDAFVGLGDVLGAGARAGALTAAKQLGKTVALDATRPRIKQWLTGHAAELVKQTMGTSKDAVRTMVQAGVDMGRHPKRLAQDIRSVVGLTDPQATAVAHRREYLLSQDLPTDRVNTLTDRYAEHLLKVRADSIARTESMLAVNQGRTALWEQLVEDGEFPAKQMQEWDATADKATCEICAAMHGKQIEIGEEWELPDGESVKSPPAHPSCLPAGVSVGDAVVERLMRRNYSGDMINIETASGIVLPVTPNHPILTPRGMVPAKFLQHGDEVISNDLCKRVPAPLRFGARSAYPDRDDMPSRIEQVFDAGWFTPTMLRRHVPVSPMQFHGDGTSNGQIDIVDVDCLLTDRLNTAFQKPLSEEERLWICACLISFARLRPFCLFRNRGASASARNIGRMDESFAFRCIGLFHALEHCSTAIPGNYPGLQNTFPNHRSGGSKTLGQGLFGRSVEVEPEYFIGREFGSSAPSCGNQGRGSTGDELFVKRSETNGLLAGSDRHPVPQEGRANKMGRGFFDGTTDLVDGKSREVERADNMLVEVKARGFTADRITHLGTTSFHGSVFNMQTRDGWYTGNGIVTSNCRCTVLLVDQ